MTFAPFTLPWDNAPVDISFVFQRESPAGKHGFLGTQGSRFLFEDGIEARFWGVCFNAAANFPSHEYSERVAERLAKFGVNMVRTHQLDAEWSTPNIFQFTKGRALENTLSLDARSLERLDYLICCLKQAGVYINLDLLCYRQFKPGDGVDAVNQLGEAAKPYGNYDPRLIELQKKYAHDLLTHVNPYTGLAYKDDAAIALVGLVNECDLLNRPVTLEPYRSRLEEQYRQWAQESGVPVGAEKVDFAQRTPPLLRFLCEMETRFYREMTAYLRSIGLKVPVTGSNQCAGGLPLLAALGATDYTDCHNYWRYFEHGINHSFLANRYNTFERLSFMRRLDRPFFVSEWDEPWPNEWRAECPLIVAAVAAFQGWGGLTIHTYRYRCTVPVDHLGGVTMGRYRHRRYFDTFNDPAKFGLFYHAALLLRRGDVEQARESVGIAIPAEMLTRRIEYPTPYGWSRFEDRKPPALEEIPALILATERHRVGMVLPGQNPAVQTLVTPGEPLVDEREGQITSDTGQLHRDCRGRIGWIDTPRTKAAYGFLGDGGEITLNGLKLRVKTPFATIAVSSLADEPVNQSNNLLLTAVGRADNSDARYNSDRTQQLEAGHGPILVEVIEASIELTTSHPDLRVWAVNPEGHYSGTIATEYVDGILSFEIGKPEQGLGAVADPTIYYLIHT